MLLGRVAALCQGPLPQAQVGLPRHRRATPIGRTTRDRVTDGRGWRRRASWAALALAPQGQGRTLGVCGPLGGSWEHQARTPGRREGLDTDLAAAGQMGLEAGHAGVDGFAALGAGGDRGGGPSGRRPPTSVHPSPSPGDPGPISGKWGDLIPGVTPAQGCGQAGPLGLRSRPLCLWGSV